MAKQRSKHVKELPVYIPGVCNIGPAERAKRRRAGITSVITALVMFILLLAINAPRNWRLLLILPVTGAATGFLQDAFHFCAGFGAKGLYNLVNPVGTTEVVASEASRQIDRKKSIQIISLSFGIGVAVALISML